MNIVQVQDQLKNFSQDQLVREMQAPSGNTPQYLVLSEIMRRQRMQADSAAQQSKGEPQTTVADEAIAAAGVPQGGIADMARALAPKTDMAENTGVQAMAKGGTVKKMAEGGAAKTDPAIIAMANRVGMSVEEYLASVGEEEAARLMQGAEARATRARMLGMEPQQESFLQRVNPSYTEDLTGRFPDSGFSEPGPDYLGESTYDGGAPPSRPGAANADMTSIAEAVAAGKARGGRGGILDAMLASGAPITSADMYLPPERLIPAAGTPEGQYTPLESYYPGAAAATELNLPQLRAALGGAGLASGLRSAAENYSPPIEPGAGRSGALTGIEERSFGQRYIGDPLRSMFQPIGDAAREIGQPIGESAREIGQPIGESAREIGQPVGVYLEEKLQPFGDFLRENLRGVATSSSGTPAMAPNRADAYRMAREAEAAAVPPPFEESGRGGSPNPIFEAEQRLRQQLIDEGYGPEEIDMEAEARKSAEEAAALRDKAGITDARDSAGARITADQNSGGAGSGGTGSGGSGAASGMSSYEQELMDALGRREKAAEQDKWLALAQVGLNMMSSTQPTFAGAIGEAGLKGVETARAARDQYDKDRLDLLGAIEQSRQSRAAAAAAAARSGAKAKELPMGVLDIYDAQIESLNDALTSVTAPPSPDDQLRLADERDALLAERSRLQRAYLSQFGIAASGASPAATSGVYSMEEVPS